MDAIAILAKALQRIPPRIRFGILVVWALLVATAGALRIADVDTGALEPLLLYVGGYLGVQSAANIDGEWPPR